MPYSLIMRFLLLVFLAFSFSASAELVVYVCGHSQHECKSDPNGGQTFSNDPGSAVDVTSIGTTQKDLKVVDSIDSSKVDIPTDQTTDIQVPSAVASKAASGGQTITTYRFSGRVGTYSSVSEACTGLVADFNSNPATCESDGTKCSYQLCGVVSGSVCQTRVIGTTSDTGCSWGQTINTGTIQDTTTQPYSCGPGYTLSGSTCNLSDARQAVDDQKEDIDRNGQTFSKYDNDRVGTLRSLIDSVNGGTGNRLLISGYDADGNPRVVATVINTDGSSSSTVYTQKTDTNGSSYVRSVTYNFSSSGVVSAAASGSTSGGIVSSGGTSSGGAPNFTPGSGGSSYTPSQQPQTGSQCGGSGQPACAMDDSGR